VPLLPFFGKFDSRRRKETKRMTMKTGRKKTTTTTLKCYEEASLTFATK
jgi:hypothetical protein